MSKEGSTQRRYDDVAVGGKLSTWYYVIGMLHNRVCRKVVPRYRDFPKRRLLVHYQNSPPFLPLPPIDPHGVLLESHIYPLRACSVSASFPSVVPYAHQKQHAPSHPHKTQFS